MAAGGATAPATGMVEHAYGRDALQKLDFWAAKDSARPAPIVIFVHGGGWKRGDKRNATGADKVTHYLGQGYAVASVNYRLVPAAKVEDQAADVAAAFAWLRTNAAKLGIDPKRMVLMGHSAGAHLVALVGTDPAYARAAGFALSDIKGVIPLDGAAYDVAAQMADGPGIMQDTYAQAFGSDPARQKSLSPTAHADGPNAPAFLILHVDREDGKRQSEALGAALRKAGTPAQVTRMAGRGLIGHMEINRKLGQAGYPATPVVDAWLKTRFQP
ncbi:alpha/beta hydrolase [Sphingomonas sp. J315]|nr:MULTISPECIES: alpha/beta hydrolase [unclassified Sphingomonas]MCR5871761.1 alpha/beta hydrolase [Sphingomonas sp. J344]UUY01339.1 alpha/beta hydrolase [Sphingomonas sp. J315]